MYRKRGSWSLTRHQVARKSLRTAGHGFGRNRGLDQHTKTASVGVSLDDSHNWRTWLAWGSLPALCSKDFGRGCPEPIRRAWVQSPSQGSIEHGRGFPRPTSLARELIPTKDSKDADEEKTPVIAPCEGIVPCTGVLLSQN
jgi:hypothetical protein